MLSDLLKVTQLDENSGVSLPRSLELRTELGASADLTVENRRPREARCLPHRLPARPRVKRDWNLWSFKAPSCTLATALCSPRISDEEMQPPFQLLPSGPHHSTNRKHCGGRGSQRPRTYSGSLPVESSDILEGARSWRERDQVRGRESVPGLAPEDTRPCTPALRTGRDGEASSLGRSPRGPSYGPRLPSRTAPPSAGSGSSQPAGSPRGSGEL